MSRLATIMSLTLACAAAAGQGVRVSASVDSATVTPLETFTLTIKIEGQAQTRPLRLPKLKNFDVLDGPSTGVSTQFINGRIRRSVSYSYTLRAKRVGSYVIPAFKVSIRGKQYSTKPISINVVKGGGKRNLTLDQAAFVEWAPSKTEAYVYEQIELAIRLYVYKNFQVRNLGMSEFSSGKHFLEESLGETQPREDQVVRDELVYDVREFPLRALFPVVPGKQTIPEATMHGRLLVPRRGRRRGARGFFDDPFFDAPFGGMLDSNYDTHRLAMKAAPVTITVKPLPEEGRPADFSGVVGKYDLQASITPQKVKLGDGVTLTMVVSGQGYIKAVGEPQLESEDGFKVYRSEVTTEPTLQGGVLGGRKVFKRIIEPTRAGVTEVPAVVFSFFDPKAGKYVTLRRGPFPLTVEKHEKEQALVIAPVPTDHDSKQGVAIQTEDIVPIMASYSSFPNQAERLYRKPVMLVVVALPPLVLLVSLLVQRRRERLVTDTGYARAQRAFAAAKERLAEAKRMLEADSSQEASGKLGQALRSLIADKRDVPPASVSPMSLGELLAEAGVDAGLIARTRDALEACDQARFSAGSEGREHLHELYDDVSHLVRNLDKRL